MLALSMHTAIPLAHATVNLSDQGYDDKKPIPEVRRLRMATTTSANSLTEIEADSGTKRLRVRRTQQPSPRHPAWRESFLEVGRNAI